jgi:hypothetical protein
MNTYEKECIKTGLELQFRNETDVKKIHKDILQHIQVTIQNPSVFMNESLQQSSVRSRTPQKSPTVFTDRKRTIDVFS